MPSLPYSPTNTSDGTEKDDQVYISTENAPHNIKGRENHLNVQSWSQSRSRASSVVRESNSYYVIDKNKPETFLNSYDLEKVTDSEIYPQKRLFSFLHSKNIPTIPTAEERKVYPLYHTNFIYRTFFWWVFPILKVGYKRTLQPDDLWAMDDRISIEKLFDDFSCQMDWYFEKSRNEYRKAHPEATKEEVLDNATLPKYALVKALLFTFKFQYFFAFLAMALSNCASAFSPMLTKRVINFVEEKALSPGLKVNKGVGYAIGSCIMMLVTGVLFNHFFHNSQLTGVQVKTVLMKAILTKSLKLSGYSKHKFPNGKITSLMTTDLSRLELAIAYQPLIGSFLVAAIICIVQLIINLGPIALVGIGVFCTALFMAAFVIKRMIKVRKSTNKFTDARVILMREILNSMKMIKYYAWEDAYEASVEKQRSKEISNTRIIQFTRNFLTSLAVCLANISSMVTFLAMYKVSNGGRTPGNIFSSLSLFQVLSSQLFFLPMALSTAVDGSIGLNRIQALLVAPEEYHDVNDESNHLDDEAIAFKMEDASFEWEDYEVEEAKEVVREKGGDVCYIGKHRDFSDSETSSFDGFHNLSFEIKKGELIIITGSIGVGKSSLLSAMSGFMRKTSGKIYTNGTLLLCGYPWIQNTSVRDNILFGSPYDEEKYRDVIKVCSLQADLDILPAGDRTEIGERGITLSGGQKARINLARSVYKTLDVYLFDDVLSAVDARVGKNIMDQCLMGRLDGKTRILATHQLSLIARASRIIYLGPNDTFDIGTVDEVKSRNPGFVKLMEFSNLSSKDEEGSEDETHVSAYEHQNKEILELEKLITKKSNVEEILDDPAADGKLTLKEERAVNGISINIYKEYISAGCGKMGFIVLPIYAVLIVSATFTLLFSSVWLSFWTENKFPSKGSGFYMGLYVFFVFMNYFCTTGQFTLLCYLGLTASKWLNLKAVKRLLHTPMSFIDTTPLGRILNRFTKDTDTLDTELTESTRLFVYQLANMIGVVVMCIIYLPWFAIAVPFLFALFIIIADHYQSSSREIKRLDAIQRSFVYNNFNEVLGGMDTIRAYKSESRFLMKSDFLMNRMNEAGYLVVAVQKWVSICIHMVATVFALIIALLCVTRQFQISASSVGVLLTYVLQLPGLLNTLMRAMTQGENAMNSAERLVSYATELPLEAQYRKPEMSLPEKWPSKGEIDFENVSLSYRPGLPSVLKNLTFKIASGEKVGICGRTGAGKSTIMTALYRLCELQGGSIFIDDVDISKLGLFELRSKLSIIPQDPVLFRGTIRKNLDPFHERTDEELWNALVRGGAIEEENLMQVKSQNKSTHNMHKFHLSQEVEDDGVNFSLGERQLLALTRALVRQSRILILDEATSSVDYQTDAKIQIQISKEFSTCTILCVAHRLNTILDYDRILVLDQGRVCEFDKPKVLYAKGGIFADMCARSGITETDFK